jgi:hypothetical protein
MQDLHPVSELGLDLREVPHFAKIPRFMWGDALRNTIGWLRSAVRFDAVGLAEREMAVAYFLGYVVGRHSRRRLRELTRPDSEGLDPMGAPASEPDGVHGV